MSRRYIRKQESRNYVIHTDDPLECPISISEIRRYMIRNRYMSMSTISDEELFLFFFHHYFLWEHVLKSNLQYDDEIASGTYKTRLENEKIGE